MTRPSIDQVLDTIVFPQLNKLASVGRNRWKACCPAHDDKSPSFAIGIGDSGQILFKCFSGCSADEICNALGMEMTDLFPDSATPRTSRPLQPTEDTFVIAIYKSQARKGVRHTDADRARYMEACKREAYR